MNERCSQSRLLRTEAREQLTRHWITKKGGGSVGARGRKELLYRSIISRTNLQPSPNPPKLSVYTLYPCACVVVHAGASGWRGKTVRSRAVREPLRRGKKGPASARITSRRESLYFYFFSFFSYFAGPYINVS
jgi:hypothetical protein